MISFHSIAGTQFTEVMDLKQPKMKLPCGSNLASQFLILATPRSGSMESTNQFLVSLYFSSAHQSEEVVILAIKKSRFVGRPNPPAGKYSLLINYILRQGCGPLAGFFLQLVRVYITLAIISCTIIIHIILRYISSFTW